MIPAISSQAVIDNRAPGQVGVPAAGAGPPIGTNRITAKKFAPQSPSEIVRIVARMAIALEYPVRFCQGSFIREQFSAAFRWIDYDSRGEAARYV